MLRPERNTGCVAPLGFGGALLFRVASIKQQATTILHVNQRIEA